MDDGKFTYFNPVSIRFGTNLYLDALIEIIGPTKVRIGLFYGHSAMKKLAVVDHIKKALNVHKIEEFGDIDSNPDIQKIDSLAGSLADVDWIIGIGGGSVLDTAKTVAFLVTQKKDLQTFLKHENIEPSHSGIPLIAIPTTSGTGSEVTPWATIWDFNEKKKFSLSDTNMFPKHAIVDPSLTLSLPPNVTAYTSFDALSHALEAYWSLHANPISDVFALEAIRLIMTNLDQAINDLNSLEYRIALAKASLFSGLAFSNTKTAAVHSISYPMTLHYGIPHGVACALTLAEFWQYNLSAIDSDKVSRLLHIVGESDPAVFGSRIKALASRTGLPTTLSEACIPKEGIGIIVNEGFHPDRVDNNPRKLNRKELREILERLYE